VYCHWRSPTLGITCTNYGPRALARYHFITEWYKTVSIEYIKEHLHWSSPFHSLCLYIALRICFKYKYNAMELIHTHAHTHYRYHCIIEVIYLCIRVKSPLCFNWAPRHEGVLWEWRYSSMHFWPRKSFIHTRTSLVLPENMYNATDHSNIHLGASYLTFLPQECTFHIS
jgi:hypothetical protein